MTKKRKLILQLLEEAASPLTVAQIKNFLGSKVDLSTIYRTLQFLESNNFLSSFPYDCSNNGIERYYLINQSPHSHFMHCHTCHKFFPLKKCPFSKNLLKTIEKKTGFQIQNHFITFKGLCTNCQSIKISTRLTGDKK